jgi:predicted component of type VI protein secretion system
MKVKLSRRLGQNPANSVIDYDEGTARFLVQRGFATPTASPTVSQAAPAEQERAELPPQSGRGSGRDAWAAYARANGVTVDDEDGRDEIIAACEDAGVPVE